MLRCPNCKTKVARFPLKDNNGNIIWKNLFKMDLMSILWIVMITILVISYKADIKKCEEMITDPLKYCEESNACKIIEERKIMGYGILDLDDMPELDVIE